MAVFIYYHVILPARNRLIPDSDWPQTQRVSEPIPRWMMTFKSEPAMYNSASESFFAPFAMFFLSPYF